MRSPGQRSIPRTPAGREKTTVAIYGTVVQTVLSEEHEIESWRGGEQTRSFMLIEDGLSVALRIMELDIGYPINLGSAELVSIDPLADIVEEIAGVKLRRRYKLDAPQGVRGRNSDNTHIRAELGWEPSIPLREGHEKSYCWIYDEFATGHSDSVYSSNFMEVA